MVKITLLEKDKYLFVTGLILVCAGIIGNEWTLAKAFSSDGILEGDTRAKIWIFDVIFLLIGIILIRHKKYEETNFRLQWLSLGLSTLAVLLLLIVPIIRIGFKFAIDYNEGCNVYHGLKAASGQLLYDNQNEWTPVNYPPLSFYLVGIIGRLSDEPLLAGRCIAFLSLLLIALGVAYAVRKLGGEVYDAGFAGIFCIGLFAAHATSYVGMDDPQILGHVFATGGLLIYLQNPIKNHNIFIAALLCAIGFFIKHILIPIPLAITIDIFLRSRKNFFKWIGYLTFIMVSFVFMTYTISGPDFLDQLTIGRSYDIWQAIDKGLNMGTKLLIPLIAILPWVFHAFKKEGTRIVSMYIVIAIPLGFYISGGSGADVNYFFDTFIGMSIAAGMLLPHIRTYLQINRLSTYLYKYANLICAVLPIILSFGLFATSPQKMIGLGMYSELKIREETFLEDAAFLTTQHGPTLCENILLCYYAGKSFEYDPYLTVEMTLSGRISENKILDRLESGYFRVIQIDEQLPDQYLQDLAYTSVQRQKFGERFTENFKRALGKYYYLIRKTNEGAFYVPKSSGQQSSLS